MANFNYISNLRTNCGDPCASQDCNPNPPVTCADIEFPTRFGVEFGGTVLTTSSDDCGEFTNFYGGPLTASIVDYGFPWYGTPFVVEYTDEPGLCRWCIPESDDYQYGEVPDGLDNDQTAGDGCGEAIGYCGGVVLYDSADFGWQSYPSGVTGTWAGICEPCDVAYERVTIENTVESIPTVFHDIDVKVEKRTAAQSPEFADGLRVTCSFAATLGGQNREVKTTNECLIECAPYDCDGDTIPAFLLCFECGEDFNNPWVDWTCTRDSVDIGTTYTRFFPGATSWDDIKDEEIPAVSDFFRATTCEELIPVVQPFFSYDQSYACGDPAGAGVIFNPPGAFVNGPYDYRHLNYNSEDNFIILRDV